ncbi:hypothetical protein K1719_020270 [Acacia pycnantha]|nr:hypothetical protein K1719_020270 [Acacia pycnantha]
MDGDGGCCIGKYATGAHDTSKVDKIMLRFRPIAPKPVIGSTAYGGSLSESSVDAFSRYGGVKRELSRVHYTSNINCRRNQRCNRRRKHSPKQSQPAVTLPLLPLTPDTKDLRPADLTVSASNAVRSKAKIRKPMRPSFENFAALRLGSPASYCCGGTSTYLPPAVAGSYVTVECVTDTRVEGEGLGCTDEERRVNLSKDTCPGMISDGYGRVTWTNDSYRRMVCEGEEEKETVGLAWLVMEEVGETASYRSFTCRVKVKYTRGKQKGSLTMPCDVWRMDSGGFAWRLDVEAALSL